MAVRADAVADLKTALTAGDDLSGRQVRERFEAVLGNGCWDQNDNALQDYLDRELDGTQAASLEDEAAAAVSSGRTDELAALLMALLDRPAPAPAPDPAPATTPAARFTAITPVDGYPGWWCGHDEDEPDVDGGYKYVVSSGPPSDATPGWVGQSEAFATMQATAVEPAVNLAEEPAAQVVEARFTHVAPVEGHPEWWSAFDTDEPQVDGGYKYVRSGTEPDDRTAGWQDRTTAFAAMQQPAAPAAADPEAARLVADAIEAALHGVDGGEQLSPEDIQRALAEALSV